MLFYYFHVNTFLVRHTKDKFIEFKYFDVIDELDEVMDDKIVNMLINNSIQFSLFFFVTEGRE